MRTWKQVREHEEYVKLSPAEKKQVADTFLDATFRDNPKAKGFSEEEKNALRKTIYSTIPGIEDQSDGVSALSTVTSAADKAVKEYNPIRADDVLVSTARNMVDGRHGQITADIAPDGTVSYRPVEDKYSPGYYKFMKTFESPYVSLGAIPEQPEVAEAREQELRRYRGMTADEAIIADAHRRNFKSDIMDAITESTIGKMLRSYRAPETQQQIDSTTPVGYQYIPKNETLHSVANVLADTPLYAAGTMLGGPAGTFALPASLRALYEAKLSGKLPQKIETDKDVENLKETLGSIGKEWLAGTVEGYAMHRVGMLAGTVAERLGMFKLLKKVPEKVLATAVRIPTATATLSGTGELLQEAKLREDVPFSLESMGKTATQVAILEAIGLRKGGWHSVKERIEAQKAIKAQNPAERLRTLTAEIRQAKENGTLKEFINQRMKAEQPPAITEARAEVPADPKAKFEQTIKDASEFIRNKQIKDAPDFTGRLRPEPMTDTPVLDRERNPVGLEQTIKTHYPEGYDSKQKQVKDRFKGRPKVREMLDRSLQTWIDDIKYAEEKDPGLMQRLVTDNSLAEKYFDINKMDKVAQKQLGMVSKTGKQYYMDALRADMSDYIKRYSDYDTIEQIRRDKEGAKPYQTVHEPGEGNREAFEAAQKEYIPPTEKGETFTNREQSEAMKREIEGKKSLVGKKLTADMTGEPAIESSIPFQDVSIHDMPQEATRIVRESIGIDDVPTKFTDRNMKDHARHVKDRYISSMGRSVAEYTDAGKNMVSSAYKMYKESEIKTGEMIDKLRYGIQDLTADKKFMRKYEDVYIDLLDKGEAYVNERRKAKLTTISDTDYARLKKAADNTRAVLDEIHKESIELGLKEYHPKVALWKVVQLKEGFVVVDNGEIREVFASRGDAIKYKEDHLYTPITYRSNYFPHVVDAEKLKDVKERHGFIKHLIDKKIVPDPDNMAGMTPEQVRKAKEKAAERLIENGANVTERGYGNLQNSRDFNIPDRYLQRNIHVIEHYVEEAVARLERAKAFGINDEKIYQEALNVAKEASDRYSYSRAKTEWDKALNLANTITNRIATNADASALTNAVLNFQVVRKMPTSQIGQLPQMFAGIWRGNFTSFIKAVGHIREPEMKRFVTRCGVNLESTRRGMLGTIGDTTFTTSFLQKTGFVKTDAIARSVATVTGKYYTEFLSEKLLNNKYTISENGTIQKGGKDIVYKRGQATDKVVRQIEKLGIDPKEVIKNGGLSDKDIRTAANTFETDTNFRARAIDLPEFRQSNWGRVVTQFKSFMYSMTKSMRNNVYQEARYGNFQPLLYLALASGLSGAIVNEIRGAITGRESGIKRMLEGEFLMPTVDAISAAGGLGIFEMFMNGTKYGDPQLGATMNDFFRVMSTAKNVYAAENWETKGYILAKDAANQLPLGSRWRRTVQLMHNSPDYDAADLLLLPSDKINRRPKSGTRSHNSLGGLRSLKGL